MIIKAQYILTSPGLVLEGYALKVGNNEIYKLFPNRLTSLYRDGKDEKLLDLGDSILLPAFINCYNRLWLTNLKNLHLTRMNFQQWINKVKDLLESWSTTDYINSIKDGIELSLKEGVYYITDFLPLSIFKSVGEAYDNSKCKIKKFAIISGLKRKDYSKVKEQLDHILNGNGIGIAPHSCYSTAQFFYKLCIKLAKKNDLFISTNACEIKEEIDLFKSKSGFWSPISYFEKLGLLDLKKLILVHCNYLSTKDIKLLSQRQPFIAYCPRTSAYFGIKKHPLKKLLQNKIPVVLGTDSLATTSSLSILDEMRFVYKNYKIRPVDIFNMVYENAPLIFKPLNIGKIFPRYKADMVYISGKFSKKNILEEILADGNLKVSTIS